MNSEDGARKVTWFGAGVVTVLALIAVYTFADGYFSHPGTAEAAEQPKVVIEGY